MGQLKTGNDTWDRGDQVVLRYRKAARLSWAIPATVVEDTLERLAYFVAPGTPLKRPVTLDGTPLPRSAPYEVRWRTPWRLGDGTWTGTSVLWTWQPGNAYSVGMFWREPDHDFLGWYVNLQTPLRRTAVGFDTADHVLDLQVSPDLVWTWKDEDEFASAEEVGRFTSAEAQQVRAAGTAAIEKIERRAWPFNLDWTTWRPDAVWPIPHLPEGWDQPC